MTRYEDFPEEIRLPGSDPQIARIGNVSAQIRQLGFDTLSAQAAAREGRIEAWVHRYLTAGKWANLAFSEGLKLEKRWWNGPVEVNLADLTRVVGPEPGMKYPVSQEYWQNRTRQMAENLGDPSTFPPLIVNYSEGSQSVSDGNTRYGAMELLGWLKCWVIFWYTQESDYLLHRATLFGGKP